ncbi:MAG TPA: chemotaxis protein CheX [Pirellulaceae bacterium]
MNASPQLLREVFSKVLEKQAFIFAEEMEIGDMVDGGDWVEASMSFRGPFDGNLSLALSKPAELEIAANFLGKDADDPEVARFAEDSLKEILNVVCGHALTALAGENPVFDLSIPEVRPVPTSDWSALAARPGTLGFDVEGHPALLRFQAIDRT